jgi:hypothetical protein
MEAVMVTGEIYTEKAVKGITKYTIRKSREREKKI